MGLERHRIRVGVDALSRALARLADKGVLEIVSGPHDPLYRLRDRVNRPSSSQFAARAGGKPHVSERAKHCLQPASTCQPLIHEDAMSFNARRAL